MKRKVFVSVILLLGLMGCQKANDGSSTPSVGIQQAARLAQESETSYQKSVATYQKVLAQDPSDPEAMYQLGRLYFDHGKYDLAIRVLQNGPSRLAQKLLAISYYRNGDYTEALSAFEKVGEDEDEDYLLAYAATCEKHNLYMEALKLYAKIHTASLTPLAQSRIQDINAHMVRTDVRSLDADLRSAIEQAPSAEDLPEAGAVVLRVKEEVVIKEDDTVEETQYVLLKILNERGKHLGEIEIGYDSTYEKVDVEFARTITPSGEVISAGAKHMRDVSRYLNFPLYSNARAKIVSMPEVSIGAFLEYKVRTVQNKMVAQDQFNIDYFLQSDDPIRQAEFIVTVPKKSALNQKNINMRFAKDPSVFVPQKTENSNAVVYTWSFNNIAQLVPEPDMPPVCEVTPIMLLSTFKTWQQIYDWWWPLTKDKIRSDPAIDKKVHELIQGAQTPEEKAKAIYNFCARDIRYVGIEYGQAGYEPHPASEIFSNKYGDCKDQAILLVTMLQDAGLEAYPVLIGTKGVPRLQKDFPCLLFNHCIAAVQIGENLVFLDPTAETVLFGDLPSSDQGREVVLMSPHGSKIVSIPKFSADHNKIDKTTTLVFLDEKTIAGSRQVATSGVFDQMQRGWLRYTMPSLIEETLRQKSQEILPGSKLTQYHIEHAEDMTDDIVLSYEFTGSDFLMKAGPGVWVIPQLGGIDLDVVARDQRLFDIDLDLPQTHRTCVEIQLPAGYRVTTLPEPVVVDNAWLTYRHVYVQNKDKIIFTEESVSKKDAVDAQQYFQYKTMLESLSKDIRQSIVVEKIRGRIQKEKHD